MRAKPHRFRVWFRTARADEWTGRPPPHRSSHSTAQRFPVNSRTLLAAALLAAFASCANLKARRTTETSGTFKSTGYAFTLLSWDLPRSAILIASENVSDQGLPNTVIEDVSVTDLGWFAWVLGIIGVRRASIAGTWGYVEE